MALTVAFEGLPGCGKTTVIQMLAGDLRGQGLKIGVVDIETTGHAPNLRAVARTYPVGHPARIMLFWVLRLQQYDAMEATRDGLDILFADRFWGSTLAFDVYGNGVPREFVEWIGRHIKRHPDVTIFLDAPLEVVRRRKKAKTIDNPGFAWRIVQGYQELADALHWVRVDATQAPEQVKERCLGIVLSKLAVRV